MARGPAATAIMGWSLGGLSAFDLAWRHPERFGAVGVFSGAFWWRTDDSSSRGPADQPDHAPPGRETPGHPALRMWFETGRQDERPTATRTASSTPSRTPRSWSPNWSEKAIAAASTWCTSPSRGGTTSPPGSACFPNGSAWAFPRLILLGGGRAHLFALEALARGRLAPAETVLVAADRRHVSAAMLPGYLAGRYTLDDISLDLARLAEAVGARFVPGVATRIDAFARTVTLADGTTLPYDVASVAIGGQPLGLSLPGVEAHTLRLKPTARLPEIAAALTRAAAAAGPEPLQVAVVGGGAAGVEMALAVPNPAGWARGQPRDRLPVRVEPHRCARSRAHGRGEGGGRAAAAGHHPPALDPRRGGRPRAPRRRRRKDPPRRPGALDHRHRGAPAVPRERAADRLPRVPLGG